MMMNKMPFDVTHDVFCVLYANSTGEIVFVHRAITLGDERPQSSEDIEAEARRNMHESLVRHHRPHASKLSALHLSPDKFEHGRKYHVDCATGTLYERSRDPGEESS